MSKTAIEIKNLGNTDIALIVECLTESFKNYFVKMPAEVEFWERRFKAARVVYHLSYGCFDNGKLIAIWKIN